MRYLTLLLLLCGAARADVVIEAGPANLSDSNSGAITILINERFDHWLIGVGYVGAQVVHPRWEKDRGLPEVFMRPNLFIHGQRLWRLGKFEFGFGAAYFQNTNRALGRSMTVSVSFAWHVTDDISFLIRHFSNAGSGTPNLGQDAILIGWTF